MEFVFYIFTVIVFTTLSWVSGSRAGFQQGYWMSLKRLEADKIIELEYKNNLIVKINKAK